MRNNGYTLIEILTAIIIVTILVAMAVPLYEKTIERSRMTEARSVLAKLQDAKLLTMDNMGCNTFSTSNASCPKVKHLNVAFADGAGDGYTFQTKDFTYSLVPTGVPTGSYADASLANAVCAQRRGGDYAGTVFVYASPEVMYSETAQHAASPAVFYCVGAACESYGLDNTAGVGCLL